MTSGMEEGVISENLVQKQRVEKEAGSGRPLPSVQVAHTFHQAPQVEQSQKAAGP